MLNLQDRCRVPTPAPPTECFVPPSTDTPENDARTDRQLVADANGGDESAFHALYLRYRDWIVRLAYRFTRDADESLDVLQDVWVYFLGKFPGFELTAQLTTFLYPAVKHVAISRQKRSRRFAGDDAVLQGVPAAPPPGKVSDQRRELAAVMANLSDLHREVVLLRFVDDLSMAEIASVLDIPVGTVKSRLHNALRMLREDKRTQRYFEA